MSEVEELARESEMQLTVVNDTDGMMHVHKVGCQDIAKKVRSHRSNGEFGLIAETREEAVREIWSDFIDEWDGDLAPGEENTKFYPCSKL
jgi:hypothetical protein